MSVPITVSGYVRFNGNRNFTMVDSENAGKEVNENNKITHSMADCEYNPPVGLFNPQQEWSYAYPDIPT